jgi:hypothetical protein
MVSPSVIGNPKSLRCGGFTGGIGMVSFVGGKLLPGRRAARGSHQRPRLPQKPARQAVNQP